MTRRRIGCAALAAALIATNTTGCNVPDPHPATPSTGAQAADQLHSLPTLEETKTQLEGVVNDIRAATATLRPGLAWLPRNGESGANCSAPYDQSGGRSLYLPDLVATGANLSDHDWATILAAAKASAAKIGATDEHVMQDGPGNHDVGFYGPAGSFVKIGYHGNLAVSTYTGCRLPQDEKRSR